MKMQKLMQTHHNLGQKWFIRFCDVFLSVLVIFSMIPVHAQQLDAGRIEKFQGSPNDFSWTRNKQALTVSQYSILQTGDQIKVNGQKASITLSLANNQTDTLKYQDTISKPYEVKIEVSCGVRCNLWGMAENWLASLFVGGPKDSKTWPRNLNIPVKTTPSLAELDDTQLLADGKKELYVFWTGGSPQYHVKVVQKGSESVWAEEKGETKVAKTIKLLDKSALTKGKYQIVINNNIVGHFTVVDDSPNSNGLENIKKSQLPPNTQEVLRATFFAKQGKRWHFEAYQHVAGIADANANAQRIKAELEKAVPGLPP